MELTDWLRGEDKPIRRGVYMRELGGRWWYAWWTGRSWCAGATSAREAWNLRHERSRLQLLPWRGLTKPAKGEATAR